MKVEMRRKNLYSHRTYHSCKHNPSQREAKICTAVVCVHYINVTNHQKCALKILFSASVTLSIRQMLPLFNIDNMHVYLSKEEREYLI